MRALNSPLPRSAAVIQMVYYHTIAVLNHFTPIHHGFQPLRIFRYIFISLMVIYYLFLNHRVANHISVRCISILKFFIYTFRRSSATLAYNLGVPMQDIQQHGTWVSNAVWSYIKPTPTQTPVTQASSNITSK